MRRRWKLLLALTVVVVAILLVAERNPLLEWMTGSPRTARGYINAGIKALGQSQPGDAIRAFQKAVELDPENARLHYLLAQALETAGRTEDAVREYRKTISLDPALAAPRYNLAVIYRLQGDYAGMEAELQQAVRLVPDFSAAHLMLGTLAYDRGTWESALSELTRGMQNPSNVVTDRISVYLMMGNSATKLGQAQQAEQYYRTVLKLDPNNREAQEQLKTLPGR